MLASLNDMFDRTVHVLVCSCGGVVVVVVSERGESVCESENMHACT